MNLQEEPVALMHPPWLGVKSETTPGTRQNRPMELPEGHPRESKQSGLRALYGDPFFESERCSAVPDKAGLMV